MWLRRLRHHHPRLPPPGPRWQPATRGASSRRRRCGRRRAPGLAGPRGRARRRLQALLCCRRGPPPSPAAQPPSSAPCRHPSPRRRSRGASAASPTRGCLQAPPSAPAGPPTQSWRMPAGAPPRQAMWWCARCRWAPGWRHLASQLAAARPSSSASAEPWRQRSPCTSSTAAPPPSLLRPATKPWQQRATGGWRQRAACRTGGCAASGKTSCASSR